MQRQLAIEAEKNGMTVPEYINRLKQQAMAQHQAQMRQQQMAQQQQQQQQQQPIQPGPPQPDAIALANWLKSQDLKPRTVIHDEKRKDMFRGMTSKQSRKYAEQQLMRQQSSAQSVSSCPPPTRKLAPKTPSYLR